MRLRRKSFSPRASLKSSPLIQMFPLCRSLTSRIDAICAFPSAAERIRITSGLRWIGLFSQEKVVPRAGNLLDTLCAQLEKLMQYDVGQRDLIILQHKFVVEWKDGKQASVPFSVITLYFILSISLSGHYYFDFGALWRTQWILRNGTYCGRSLWYRCAARPRWSHQQDRSSRAILHGHY